MPLFPSVLVIAILVLAPLIQGGNRPLALLVLEFLAILLMLALVKSPHFLNQLGKPFIVLLALMILLPILQLLPLPFSLWDGLGAHREYAGALRAAIEHGGFNLADNTSRALSLIPANTEYALLALIPPLVVFLCCVGMTARQLRALVPVFLAVAALQAIIALAEYGIGRSANGTYANRDHLAGLLEMALPISLALLASSFGYILPMQRHHRSLRNRIRAWLYSYCNRTAVYAFLSLCLLLGLIFTQSRTGVMLAMLITVLAAIAFATRLGGRNVYGMVGTYAAAGLSLAILIGLVPVLDRFVLADHLQDARWTIYASVYQVIGEFLPFGSGMGTFGEVFQRYHPVELSGVFINRAHNDYLEWIMEGGVLAAVIIAGLLLYYLKRWPQLFKRGAWSTFHFIQVGAGIGLFAIILHSLVDFNLRIPANQIYFAFLAALFFHRPAETEDEQGVEMDSQQPMAAANQAGTLSKFAASAAPDKSAGGKHTAPQASIDHPVVKGPNPFDDDFKR